jgi:hypothetical protein
MGGLDHTGKFQAAVRSKANGFFLQFHKRTGANAGMLFHWGRKCSLQHVFLRTDSMMGILQSIPRPYLRLK